jgi:multidrug efflux pump
MKKIASISDVTSDLDNQGLSLDVEVNRQLAARYGITPATIDNALYDALGQRIVSTIFNQSNQYRVVLVAKPDSLPSLQSLGTLYLPTQTGSVGQVPLSGIATIKVTKSPLVVSHLAQFPGRHGVVQPRVGCLAEHGGGRRPEGREGGAPAAVDHQRVPGRAAAFQDSLSSEVFLLLAALVTVYIVLGVLYESFIHPVTILSTLPSAGIGALLALMLAGHDLDVIGIIGIVLLIGIVKKNGIMIVDFALEAERHHGKTPQDAISRLRCCGSGRS